MFVTREKIMFALSVFLLFTALVIALLRKLFSVIPPEKKIVLDYEKRLSYKLFEVKYYDKFLYLKLYRHPLNCFVLKKIIRKKYEIYITGRFKKSTLNTVFEKYYNNNNLCFEECALNCLDIILKSISTKTGSICICCEKTANDYGKLKRTAEICTHFSDKIFISTQDINAYEKLNSLILEKNGIGLLYKNVEALTDCDIIININERRCDFSKKSRFVINLQKNHYICGCNLLYDFYDKSCFLFEALDVKKAFFCDKNALFFKLQWKIMKKS